jgi:hypothetical protein
MGIDDEKNLMTPTEKANYAWRYQNKEWKAQD